ncbi:MAG: endoribonuclease [Burkholderiales bacterium]|jgi:enamine deaminase RidA (YjgF/YER057c/UK114 family)|nr:endoribonuclease [Burkholderiales bacterium]
MQEKRDINAITREVHPVPDRRRELPYAPAIHVSGPVDILFLSGMTAAPLYHSHPHVREEHYHAPDIDTQVRRAMDKVKMVLETEGLTLRHVVKIAKYLTDMRDLEGMSSVLAEYFGEWKPASTTICVNCLNQPGARVEIEVTAVRPR